MRTSDGFPVIERNDQPLIVNDALHESIQYWHDEMPSADASSWVKRAADAWGALEDSFSIVGNEVLNKDGEARLFISPDQLELALVAYGCKLLEKEDNPEAIPAINGLLKEIDKIKTKE